MNKSKYELITLSYVRRIYKENLVPCAEGWKETGKN